MRENEISEVCDHLKLAQTKGELLDFLYDEIMQYSLTDLQYMRGSLEYEVRNLPPKYKKILIPKVMEQFFGAHHNLIVMYRNNSFPDKKDALDDIFPEYCDMIKKGSLESGDREPWYTFLYYLLAAFTMFVLVQPGHPAGTPFPGGFTVEERNGVFYCPIREKADDVETSICPYCPAKQS